METISNLTNQPIAVTLAGKQHKFRQLTLAELFGKFEAEVQNDWANRVQQVTVGMSIEDKVVFLSHQASHPLSAEDSVRLVRDKMNSAQGVSLILALTHQVEDKADALPEVVELMSEPVDRLAVQKLIEALTGTSGVKMEGGAEGPKAK